MCVRERETPYYCPLAGWGSERGFIVCSHTDSSSVSFVNGVLSFTSLHFSECVCVCLCIEEVKDVSKLTH